MSTNQALDDATLDTLAAYDSDDDQVAGGVAKGKEKASKDTYVGVHSSGFRDLLLRPELLRAITDCGFEHPSEGSFVAR